MRYGLIGEKLGHSFSKIIHEQLADYTYDLIPLTRDELDAFLREKQFAALNVTIPYKETVIPYLDEVDSRAQRIGAVNTVVNRNGRLCGYNTDFYGLFTTSAFDTQWLTSCIRHFTICKAQGRRVQGCHCRSGGIGCIRNYHRIL